MIEAFDAAPSLGMGIVIVRSELGLTSSGLALRLGMHRSQICRLEQGQQRPTAAFLGSLVALLPPALQTAAARGLLRLAAAQVTLDA